MTLDPCDIVPARKSYARFFLLKAETIRKIASDTLNIKLEPHQPANYTELEKQKKACGRAIIDALERSLWSHTPMMQKALEPFHDYENAINAFETAKTFWDNKEYLSETESNARFCEWLAKTIKMPCDN